MSGSERTGQQVERQENIIARGKKKEAPSISGPVSRTVSLFSRPSSIARTRKYAQLSTSVTRGKHSEEISRKGIHYKTTWSFCIKNNEVFFSSSQKWASVVQACSLLRKEKTNVLFIIFCISTVQWYAEIFAVPASGLISLSKFMGNQHSDSIY